MATQSGTNSWHSMISPMDGASWNPAGWISSHQKMKEMELEENQEDKRECSYYNSTLWTISVAAVTASQERLILLAS